MPTVSVSYNKTFTQTRKKNLHQSAGILQMITPAKTKKNSEKIVIY